jgi:hypothetical protein
VNSGPKTIAARKSKPNLTHLKITKQLLNQGGIDFKPDVKNWPSSSSEGREKFEMFRGGNYRSFLTVISFQERINKTQKLFNVQKVTYFSLILCEVCI